MQTLDSSRSLPDSRGLSGLARRLVFSQFRQLSQGELRITGPDGSSFCFGDGDPRFAPARMTVNDPDIWRDFATGGSIGAAEAYVAGGWDTPDLTALLRFFVRNLDRLNAFEDRFAWITRPALRWLHWLNRNSRAGSRRNIEAHYDLGNALFEQFLDRRMMYSSAIFPSADASLDEAAAHKLDVICRKLDLKPDDHLLEIGTGWGGLAIYAARHYGCRVTTTTISREQYDEAARRIQEAGLADSIQLLFEDYRDLQGKYDKLVSVEMIEAVGHQYLDSYLETINARLNPDGLALIQAITLPDQRYQRALRNVDFIQRHIFPGSFIPSLGAILDAMRRRSSLVATHMEDIGFHYARTLAAWRQRFLEASGRIRELGYDERFLRLWTFYFCYCEAGFAERAITTHQILLAGPENRRPNLVQAFS